MLVLAGIFVQFRKFSNVSKLNHRSTILILIILKRNVLGNIGDDKRNKLFGENLSSKNSLNVSSSESLQFHDVQRNWSARWIKEKIALLCEYLRNYKISKSTTGEQDRKLGRQSVFSPISRSDVSGTLYSEHVYRIVHPPAINCINYEVRRPP